MHHAVIASEVFEQELTNIDYENINDIFCDGILLDMR